MTSAGDLVPMREILGYGPELVDAIGRFAGHGAGAAGCEAEREKILEAYAAWVENCPNAENICYLDITLFSTDVSSVRDGLSIVVTPGDEDNTANHDFYVQTLREKYIARQNTMAPHRVFAKGLPFVPGELRDLLTANDLQSYLSAMAEPNKCESRILLGELEPAGLNAARSKPMPLRAHMLMSATEKGEFTEKLKERVSAQPILNQWERWIEVWQTVASAGGQLSGAGAPPRWIIGAPVGLRSRADPLDFSLVACLFVAFDGHLTRKQVMTSLRYVLLHLYEANATAFVQRRGELIGRNAGVLPAVHEVRRVIKAIRPGVSPRIAGIIQSYFLDIFIKPATPSDDPDALVDLEFANIVDTMLGRAAEIEAMEIFAKAQFLGHLKNEVIESEIDQFVTRVRKYTTVTADPFVNSAKCGTAKKELFELAVLGALRNVIYHTFATAPMAINLTIGWADGVRLLIMENQHRVHEHLPQIVKQSGTLQALRAYARSYDANAGLVRIDRIEGGEDDGGLWELWRTALPLPELSVGR